MLSATTSGSISCPPRARAGFNDPRGTAVPAAFSDPAALVVSNDGTEAAAIIPAATSEPRNPSATLSKETAITR